MGCVPPPWDRKFWMLSSEPFVWSCFDSDFPRLCFLLYTLLELCFIWLPRYLVILWRIWFSFFTELVLSSIRMFAWLSRGDRLSLRVLQCWSRESSLLSIIDADHICLLFRKPDWFSMFFLFCLIYSKSVMSLVIWFPSKSLFRTLSLSTDMTLKILCWSEFLCTVNWFFFWDREESFAILVWDVYCFDL